LDELKTHPQLKTRGTKPHPNPGPTRNQIHLHLRASVCACTCVLVELSVPLHVQYELCVISNINKFYCCVCYFLVLFVYNCYGMVKIV